MNKILTFFTISISIFFYIYGPDLYFLPINIVDIISLISIIYLISYRRLFLKFIFEQKLFIGLLVLTVLYLLIIETIHNYILNTNSFSILNLRIILEAIIPSFAIVLFASQNNIKKVESFYKIFIYIAIIQLIISIFMFDFDTKTYMFETFMKYDLDSPLFNPQHFLIRGFGLAKNHLFAFPFAQGIIAIIGLYYAIKKKSVFVFIAACGIVITIILNARIGLFPIILFLFLFIIVSFFNYKLFLNLLKKTFLIIILFIPFFYFISTSAGFESTINNLQAGYNATIDLILEGKKNSTYEDLASDDFWTIPTTTVGVLFGGSISELHSDIGYIRNLHYGGLFYMFFLYSTMGLLFYKVYGEIGLKNDKSIYKKILAFSLFISFFVAEIKGHSFMINEAIRLLILIWIIGYFNKKESYTIEK